MYTQPKSNTFTHPFKFRQGKDPSFARWKAVRRPSEKRATYSRICASTMDKDPSDAISPTVICISPPRATSQTTKEDTLVSAHTYVRCAMTSL
jgi:hypothetical protein